MRDQASTARSDPRSPRVAVAVAVYNQARFLADALGTHLDLFQRIHVDPASVSIVSYTDTRPFVLGTNTHGGDLSWLNAPARTRRRSSRSTRADAAVGGGAGPETPQQA